jgi:hypothetical protein
MWFSYPGQCTAGIWDCLYQWQTLIAGLLAVAAAIGGLAITIGIERKRVERELAAVAKLISVSINARKIDETETYDCFEVMAVNDGQRPVEVQQLAIRVAVPKLAFLIEAEPVGPDRRRLRPPHRLEPEQSITAKVDIFKICTALVEREIKGEVSLLGVCLDSRGAEFRSAIWPTTVEDLIEHGKG